MTTTDTLRPATALAPDRPQPLPALALLVMLLLIDVTLIALYVSTKNLGYTDTFVFDLGADRGYGEFMQYTKSTWLVAILAFLALQRRAATYVAWAAVFAYLLLDDAFQLHETIGWGLADATPEFESLSGPIGEMVWMGGVGLLLAGLIAIAFLKAEPREREVTRIMVILAGFLIFFGIVIDAAHHLLLTAPIFGVPLTILEDGGEILTLSVITAAVFATAFCGFPLAPRRESLQWWRGRA